MNWLAFSHGAVLCGSLIVTIGAQNAFVLRQGIMRSHVGKIVLLCALSDMILIGAGVGGASVLVERYPTFVHAVLYLGLAYLAWFGINALRRAFAGPRNARRARRHGRAAAAERPRDRADDARVHVAQPARVSRHVPADRHGRRTRAGRRAARVRDRRDDGQRRVVPRAGYGARLLAPWFRKAMAWRVLDGAIGSMVLFLAAVQLR